MKVYNTSARYFIYMLLCVIAQSQAVAQDWDFSPALDVTSTHGAGIFHHTESSGRRSIAVSDKHVAVVWEDNRNNTPIIFLATKLLNANGFSEEIKISGNGEAYDPSIVALDNDRFAIGWEEDSELYVRLITPAGPGPVLKVSQRGAAQISLAVQAHQLFVVYSSNAEKYPRIHFQRLGINGNSLKEIQDCAVDAKPVTDDQLYPTLVSLDANHIVAWEDRRLGHTIIMAAKSQHATPCDFTEPQRVSAGRSSGKKVRTAAYGKGHGVARVALASYAHDQAYAVWADKRIFREGYDIYAAPYQPKSKILFADNLKVQDSFGGVAQQWHPTISGNRSGMLVAAWDDNRDGNANIMLSWLQDDQWSDDVEVKSATGPGEQTHPSISLDEQSNLHLLWIDRATTGGPTRLRYTYGKYIN